MAAISFLAKRVSETLPRDFPYYFQSTTTTIISMARCLSTAYERAEGGNAVAETAKTSNDSINQGLYKEKEQSLDWDEGRACGVTGFVAEISKEGIKKAVDVAENVGDTAKKTMDDAWKAAKETAENVKNTVDGRDHDHDDHIDKDPSVVEVKKTAYPIDTQEYRSIEEVRKAGGYDKILNEK